METTEKSSIEQVRAYWQAHPLLSYEMKEVGSPEFFEGLDRAKRLDIELFAMDYWRFDQFAGKTVLDVGCGPGWLTVAYAAGGALVTAVDLTPKAVELTVRHLAFKGLRAEVREGNAEALAFDDRSFDLVVSCGVLHHTPDCEKAIGECFRVTRPGGEAKICLYRKGILHSRFVWSVTRGLMRLLGVKHPGANLAETATDVDDFIRQYDGAANPVGIGKTNGQWCHIVEQVGFRVISAENHVFPKRFIPSGRHIPVWLHALLDRWFGTMVYFQLTRPTESKRVF